MFRRIALAAGIALVLACIVLPPVLGARARALLEPRLNAMGDSFRPEATVAVWLDNWQPGWFSSTATVTLEARFGEQSRAATVAPDLAGSYRTTLPNAATLRHGPVIVGDLWGAGWGSAEFAFDATTIPDLQDFLAKTGAEAVARLTVLVSFLGDTRIALEVPPIHTTDDGATEVRFAGLEAIASVSRDGMRGSSSGTLHRLAVTDPGVSDVELGRIEWTGDFHREVAIGDSWLGGGVVELATVALRTGTGAFEMDDARVDTRARIDDDVVVGTGRYTADRVHYGGVQFADVELDIAATYPIAAAARMAASAGEVTSLPFPAETIANALHERFTLRVDPLSFRYADLPFTAKLYAEYRGDQHGDTPVAADFATLSRVTSAALEASMHKDLVQAVGVDVLARIIPAMARLDLVGMSGDEYTIQAEYRDGELLIGGKPVDLPLLVALATGL